MELDFTRLECDIDLSFPLELGLLFQAALRTFPLYFKATCCTTHRVGCHPCTDSDSCPYRVLFSQDLSLNPTIVKLHQKPSLPFAFSISADVMPVRSSSVSLVIAGTALNYLSLFYEAFLNMIGTTLKAVMSSDFFSLTGYSVDYQGNRHLIGTADTLTDSMVLLSACHVLQDMVQGDSVTINLKTPLRLLSNGSTVQRFDFAPFFRSLLRRMSALIAYYGSGQLELDFSFLSNASIEVNCYDSTVHYVPSPWLKSLSSSGLLGTVECIGLVEPMFSLLRLGSYFNVGKGATYGFGHFSLEVH